MMTMKKPILYFDMDNVLVDFQSGIDATPTRSLVYSSTHYIIKQTIRTSRCIRYRYLILWQKRLRPTKECPS